MTEPAYEGGKFCRNCQHPMSPAATYCESCGQKYTTGKITFPELFRDFLQEIFNLDSKLFKTVTALFVPGKLTKEYFAGRHRRYVHPIRLFFITAVTFFALLSFLVLRDSGIEGLSRFGNTLHERAYRAKFMDELDRAQDSLRQFRAVSTNLAPILDSLRSLLHDPRANKYELSFLYLTNRGEIRDTFRKIDHQDMILLPIDSLLIKYEIRGILSQIQVRQQIRLQTNLQDFLRYLMGQMIWMVCLMMPVLALILKLLYVRRRRYYIEHLIFSFHYHAFGFVIFSTVILLALSPWGPATHPKLNSWAFGIAGILLLVYLLVSMFRVYRQGFFKTLIKYGILNFTYIFVFLLMMTLVSLASAILY